MPLKIWCLCLWLLVPVVQAQDKFLIETVEFTGLKFNSESILRSFFQLEEGQPYTEEDMRQAQYRIDSLRFVLHSELTLKRGSKRGAYKLEVNVTETSRYFWALFSELAYTDKHYGEEEDGQPVDPSTGAELDGLTLGRRWFPGSNGELTLFFPFSPGISYSHYNLFNRRLVASLAFQADTGFGKNFSTHPENGELAAIKTRDDFGLTFSLGGLIRHNQWLNFNYKLNSGVITSINPVGSEPQPHLDTNFRNHKTEFVWRYDNKDHPLFPTSGKFLKAGLLFDREYRDVSDRDPVVPYDNLSVTSSYLYFSGEKHWARPNEHSFSLGLLARFGNHEVSSSDRLDFEFEPETNFKSSKVAVNAMLARNILEYPLLGKVRDFRLEAAISTELNRSGLDGVFPSADFQRYKMRFSLVGRDNLGLIRLSIIYRSTNEELWQ